LAKDIFATSKMKSLAARHCDNVQRGEPTALAAGRRNRELKFQLAAQIANQLQPNAQRKHV